MNESSNSKAASGKSRDTHHPAEFDEFGGNTKVPEAVRVLAEKNIAQARELYERSKDALEAVLASWEKSFDAAGKGVAALNRKAIDITQQNINTGFQYAKSIANAKNLAEAMELQTAYWRKQLSMLGVQAEEMSSLSTQVTADVTAPITAQVKRGMDELHKAT
jgi:phasin